MPRRPPTPASLRGFRRRWPRRVLIAANLLVFVVLAGTATAYGWVRVQLAHIHRVSILGLHVTGHSDQSQQSSGSSIPPFTLLGIGSDSRSISGGSSFQGTGTAAVDGQRSDSIILLRVIPATRQLAILSIPRDIVTEVPGYGMTRVNTAFNTGNPQLLVKVLQQDFGVEVNHVVETNFDTFQNIANAIGGVQVWFPTKATDVESQLNQNAGCQTLIGSQALAFVRSRNYQYYLDGSYHLQNFPESDLARIQRQQAFVKLAAQKIRKIAPTSVGELSSLVTGLTKNLTLDSGFSDSLLLQLAQIFRSANLGSIPQYTYPAENIPGTGELTPLTQQGRAMVAQWLAGGPAPAGSLAPPTTAKGPTTTSAPPTTVVAPAAVAVEVANGSGASGQAGQAGRDLTSLGYSPTVSGSRYYPSQGSNLVLYAPDSLRQAQQLRSQLVGGATLQESAALAPSPYNLELVTGSSYAGVVGGAAQGSSGSSTGTSTPSGSTGATTTTVPPSPAYVGTTNVEPDSSSYVNGQYIPPGRTPGQAVQTCSN